MLVSFRTPKMVAVGRAMGAKMGAGRAMVAMMQPSRNFDILLNSHATTSSTTKLYEPEELDSGDEDKRYLSDYGDLKINFFEESGMTRTIIHDQTDWRDNSTDGDGDDDGVEDADEPVEA
jgi:hypothetical protein